MSVTIKKIAELANTSRGTVDRVLNGRGRVNPEKAEKILKIAKEHGYEFNQFARALVNSKKQFKIGVIISAVNNDFYARVLNGIQRMEKLSKNKQLQYCYKVNNHRDYKTQLINIQEILKEEIDALIITPVVNNLIKEEIKKLEIPVVLCVHDLQIEKNNIFFVGCNYQSNGTLAADLANILIDDGNVLIVSGPSHIRSYQERNIGFTKRLKNNKNQVEIINTEETEDSTNKVLTDYFNKNKEPSLIYFNTYGINGGLQAIKDGSRKPKVIAVDETSAVINGILNDEISVTVTQQPEKQGVRCVEVIKDFLVLKKTPKDNQVIIGNKIKVKSSNFNENVW